MDLYRYFHPHHNPRLCKVPMRMQELSELAQAAIELRRAVIRAQIRVGNTEGLENAQEQFCEIRAALDFVADSLSQLTRLHPGDNEEMLRTMLAERHKAPGWENWSTLLQQHLGFDHLNLELELPPAGGIKPSKDAANF